MSDRNHRIALDELVELRSEKISGNKDPTLPYIGLEHIAQGKPRLLGMLPSSASISVNCEFSKDDILFGKLRPNLRKSVRMPFAGYCSTDILVLRARVGVRPDFAAQVFQWEPVFAKASATAAGTKMPRTSWADLKRLDVFNPENENEQTRIATVLDLADKAIAKTEDVIAKLRQVREGLLHDLLTRGVDGNGDLRDPVAHPEEFQCPSLPTLECIPHDWRVKRLDAVCSLIKDGTHIPPRRVDEGPLLLSVQNMDGGKLARTASDTRVSWEFFQEMHKNWQIQPGDVLLAIVGATIGKLAEVPKHFETFTLQRSVAILRGAEGHLLNTFLAAIAKAPFFQRQVRNSANQTAQPGLYLTQVAALKIPLPPIDEQQRILATLAPFDLQLEYLESESTKLEHLRSGLLNDLLTGRVRVPESIGAND